MTSIVLVTSNATEYFHVDMFAKNSVLRIVDPVWSNVRLNAIILNAQENADNNAMFANNLVDQCAIILNQTN